MTFNQDSGILGFLQSICLHE